jgi:arylsulfatase A-like enzyme
MREVMTMRLRGLGIGAICAMLAIPVAGIAAAQAPRRGPCAEIIAACEQAGFERGAARAGNGLQVDCVRPIMQGGVQPPRAAKPLPQVAADLLTACRAANPSFGQPPAGLLQPPNGLLQPPAPATPSDAKPALGPAPALPPGTKRPNIVFVLADDFSMNLVQFMPHVRQMQKDGVTFTNYFVTDSLCCPSRSSIFTGRYPHNTGIYRNVGPDGGYLGFVARGHQNATFAAALAAAGYRTAMLGKYLNGYQPRIHGPAPGWSEWDVAGNGYGGFDYDLNQNATLNRYGRAPADYLTDVVSAAAVRFIKQSAGTPFMIEVATFAPHAPYTPAPRDADAMPGLAAPRTPAFNAAPGADDPQWLRALRPLSDADVAGIDRDFRKRAQSVLAIDAMIGQLQAAVAAIGATDNTYFVFSSDNGYHMGEHRMMPGKMTAFDTDIRVPLVATGPSVPAGRVRDEIVGNIDLCPTFTEIAFAATPAEVDGHSLVPLLHGREAEGWRTAVLIEHRGPLRQPADPDMPGLRSGNPPTYEAIRMAHALYVEYATGEKEYHDLVADPDELSNIFASLAAEQKASLHAMLASVRSCRDSAGCRGAERAVRSATRN